MECAGTTSAVASGTAMPGPFPLSELKHTWILIAMGCLRMNPLQIWRVYSIQFSYLCSRISVDGAEMIL